MRSEDGTGREDEKRRKNMGGGREKATNCKRGWFADLRDLVGCVLAGGAALWMLCDGRGEEVSFLISERWVLC
jgi:hypothetical protein